MHQNYFPNAAWILFRDLFFYYLETHNPAGIGTVFLDLSLGKFSKYV